MAKIFVSFNTNSASKVILVARELSNLLAEVYRSPVYTPPHVQHQITIDNLNPIMHRLEVWSTTDNVTLDQLKSYVDVDASIVSTTTFGTVSFIVNRGNITSPSFDPVTPTDTYVNPELEGKEYMVFKPGYGPLVWDYHIQKISGGGFKFIDGQSFTDQEEYTIMLANPTTASVSAGGNGRGFPNDVIQILGDSFLQPTHFGSMLEIVSSGISPFIVTDFPTIPDRTMFGINTHNGAQRYVTVQLPVGKYCLINGVARNTVHIGRAEEVIFFKKGDYLRIISWGGDYRRVGQRVRADGIAPINSLPVLGGWYVKADYPRIFEWYVNELPVGEYFNDLTEAIPSDTNRGLWGIGTTKFWVPDRGGYFERNTGGSQTGRLSGNKQAGTVGPHTHPVKPPDSSGTAGVGKTTTGNEAGEGAGIITYNTLSNTGTETRPDNIAGAEYVII